MEGQQGIVRFVAKVRPLYQYRGLPGSESVFGTRFFCGDCSEELTIPHQHPSTPDDLDVENAGGVSGRRDKPVRHFAFCPWCGAHLDDEWWTVDFVENERVTDHYQNPGHHRGDEHVFDGSDPDRLHYFGATDHFDGEVCWCKPEVEPRLLKCVIRHRDIARDAVLLEREAEIVLDPSADPDYWKDDE